MNIPLRKILRTLYPGGLSSGSPNSNAARSRGEGRVKRIVLWTLLATIFLNLALLFLYYNRFLSMQYDVEESLAQIDTQLQRRRNVILNLSLMVRDYARHEKEIFTNTTDTRRDMLEPRTGAAPGQAPPADRAGDHPEPKTPGDPGTPRQAAGLGLDALLSKPRVTAEDLDTLLSRIFAIAERYPDLRLSENFQRFMDALVDAEDKIAEQRMVYNQRANIMSTALGVFPGFVFAKIYGFETPMFFQPEDEARRPPNIEQVTPHHEP